MSVSRRKFLRTGAVVSAALVLKPSTFVFGNDSITSTSAVQNKQTANQFYTREMFEPYIGDAFRVRVGKQVVDLKLVAITNEKPASGKIACKDCFSMRFEAVKPLPRATLHTLNHSKLGSFDLFMVQSKTRAKFLQTAIVNHAV
jgi:TAT (twin-arginine translocation) pathway signal sequence